MTAKELKEQVTIKDESDSGKYEDMYVFNENELNDFCQQLCKEQRENTILFTDAHWTHFNTRDELRLFIINAPMPEL